MRKEKGKVKRKSFFSYRVCGVNFDACCTRGQGCEGGGLLVLQSSRFSFRFDQQLASVELSTP